MEGQREEEETAALTGGAVGAHPAGVAAAQPRVGDVDAVAVALVGALGPRELAQRPCPARLAVALPAHTDPVPRAAGVQAVHWAGTHTGERYRMESALAFGEIKWIDAKAVCL